MGISIGLSNEYDLQVFKESVSRSHVKMETSPYGIFIGNSSLSGGTWVNGREIEKTTKQDGDEVKLSNPFTLDRESSVIRDFLSRMDFYAQSNEKKLGNILWPNVVIPVAVILVATGVMLLAGDFSSLGETNAS